tara:strand:- start:2954 stop:3151 length:198 start_codon:yes stop_codon:yes gene_type:complete
MASKDKRIISIHDFWNVKHDIITIEVESGIGGSEHLNNIEHELDRLGYKLDNINYMDITYIGRNK